jgi:hypothetical protein
MIPRDQALRDRISELEEENASLKAALGALDGLEDAHLLGLTMQEGRVYNALKRRKIATTDQLIFAMYPNDPDRRAECAPNTVRVVVKHMRDKGVPIKCRQGVGWWLNGGVESRAMNG